MMGSMPDRFSGGKEVMQRKMVKKFLQSDAAEAVLSILTQTEERLLAAVVDQHEVLGLEGAGEVPDPDQRAGTLRELWLAKVEGRFPEWWVEHYADLENRKEAAQFAAASSEEWATTKEEWADRLRRNGLEGTDDELADGHVRRRYGVPLAEFKRQVVDWPDEREAEELQDVIAGPVERAISGVEAATDHLREQED